MIITKMTLCCDYTIGPSSDAYDEDEDIRHHLSRDLLPHEIERFVSDEADVYCFIANIIGEVCEGTDMIVTDMGDWRLDMEVKMCDRRYKIILYDDYTTKEERTYKNGVYEIYPSLGDDESDGDFLDYCFTDYLPIIEKEVAIREQWRM